MLILSKHTTRSQHSIGPNIPQQTYPPTRLSWPPLCVVVQWCHWSTSSHLNILSLIPLKKISIKAWKGILSDEKRYMLSIRSQLRVNVGRVSSSPMIGAITNHRASHSAVCGAYQRRRMKTALCSTLLYSLSWTDSTPTIISCNSYRLQLKR